MHRLWTIIIPSALILSGSLQAQGRQYAETETETEQEAGPKSPATGTETAPVPQEGQRSAPDAAASGSTEVDSETVNESETDGEADDTDLSYIQRQSHSKSVEVFVDYNSFQSNKQYFTPIAYGVKAYTFCNSDLKLGLSLAMEQLNFGFDKKTLISPGNFNFQDVERTGTAVRIGAHSQYFLSNSLNVGASLFGATGSMKEGDGFPEDHYSRTGLSLSFGNQWSWDSYTVGVDWLTLTYNATLNVGGEKVLERYPSNRNGGMIVLSALSFGAEW